MNGDLTMLGKKKEEDVQAFLGQGADFTGKLLFNGTVRIDGNFNGEIFGDGTLIIGEGAHIEARLIVENVVVRGKICGEITARKRIEIYHPGHVLGKIKTPTLVIEEGGIFEGHSQMENLESHPGVS